MSSLEVAAATVAERTTLQKVKDVLTYEPRAGESVPWYWLLFKHRYCRLVWYCLVCFLTTIVYYGWQPFSGMLFKKGAYRWLCDADYTDPEPCLAQDNAVQNLFQVGLACEFIVGVVAGCLLDYMGPLCCGLVGECSFFIGWLLHIYSGPDFVAYVPAMIFMAGAVNLIAFPALILGDYFPKHSGFAMSLVVACQTGSTGVAPALEAIWNAFPTMSFAQLAWSYIAIVVLPCAIIYLFTLPIKRPSVQKAENERLDAAAAEEAAQARVDGAMDVEFPEAPPVDVPPAKCRSGASVAVAVLEEENEEPVNVGVSLKKKGIRAFIKELATLEMILFTTYYVLQLLQFGYYPTTVRSQSGQKISDFQGVMMPTQAAWGIIFGLVVDYTGTLPICALLVVMMSAVFGFVMIPSTNVQYFTSILYIVSNSYIYTVKYTYCNEIFAPANFGMLIGFIGLMGGLFTLLNIPISNVNKYQATYIAYLCVGVLCLLILFVLYLRKRKGIHYKGDEVTKECSSEVDTNAPASEEEASRA